MAPGEVLLFSNRDAATFFDTLRVPAELRSWFGQPPVTAKELTAAGMSFEDIHSMCDDRPVDGVKPGLQLFPVHGAWPMGLSCIQAGISEQNIISLDCDPPSCQDEICFVARDDAILVHKRAERGKRTL